MTNQSPHPRTSAGSFFSNNYNQRMKNASTSQNHSRFPSAMSTKPILVPMRPVEEDEGLRNKGDAGEHLNTLGSSTLRHFEDSHVDSSTETVRTDSSDEFWEGAAKEVGEVKALEETTAKRGRWLYVSFMRLYRPFRVLLVAMIGCAVLVTPYIVIRFAFPNSVARPHVVTWSLWFTVTWACAAGISILVDILPRMLLALVFYVSGKPPESLTTELEVCSVIGEIRCI